MAKSIQRILMAGVPAAAVVIVLSISAAPAGATEVCPPGVTNLKYCTNVLPIAQTGSATNVKTTSATLNGTAGPNYPNGDITTYYFQYGTSTKYGSTTPPGTIGKCPPGVTNRNYCTTPAKQAVSANIKGLKPGTTYHYRIVATNSDGTTYGADQTFRTKVVVTLPIKSVNVPRKVYTRQRFYVVVHLRVRAKVTIKFNGTTYREGYVNRSVSQRVTAPRRPGRYTVTVTAVGGNTTEIVKKTIRVVSPPRRHHP